MHGLSLGAHNTEGPVTWSRPGQSPHTRHSRHAEHDGHPPRTAANQQQDSAVVGGDVTQGGLKQALVNQIRASLVQRFDLRQSNVTLAGATPDEQAGSDLAAAVSAALNASPGASPTDSVAAVNETSSAALQQAAQSLPAANDTGTASSLNAAVAQINDLLQSLFSAYLANSGSVQGGVAAAGAKLIANASGQLQIHTLEGDTITLRFASQSGISLQALQAGSGATQLNAAAIQDFSRNRVTLSVQGDLNANELQAVQNLLAQVTQLADGFWGGDLNAALSQAGGLTFDGTQLSDYSLHLALQQTFAAYGLQLQPAPNAADTAPNPGPAVNGATPTAANAVNPESTKTAATV